MQNKVYNYGISLLRIFLCFGVILCHFWDEENCSKFLIPFLLTRSLSVPSFMLISFYFTSSLFSSKSNNNITQRIVRLYFPLIAWAFIYYIVFSLADCIFQIDYVNGISDLFYQILFGHTLNVSMWYQCVCIYLTLIFYFICHFFPSKIKTVIIILISFVSIYFQYSGINYSVFSKLPDFCSNTLGRFCEMFPYASLGLLLSKVDIQKLYGLFSIKKKFWISLSFLVLFNISLFFPIFPETEGFVYSGFNKIFQTLFLFLFAFFLPLDCISEKKKSFFNSISQFTAGIYCSHKMTGFACLYITGLLNLPKNTFLGCIVLYIISFIFCYIINLIPNKYTKLLVN